MKVKLFFLVMLPIISINFISAQTADSFFCNVEEDINNLSQTINQTSYYTGSVDPQYLANFEPISFNIYFWEINKSDGTNDVHLTEEIIRTNLKRVNELFRPMGICFVLKGFGKVNSTTHHENSSLSSIISYMVANGYYEQNSFNVYVPKRMTSGNGATYYGNDKLAVNQERVFGFWNFVPGNVVAHELAHDFNLWHPWGASNGSATTLEHVTRDVESLDYNASLLGTNSPKGDHIHDTPAMAAFWTEADALGLEVEDIIDVETCEYNGPGTDALGVAYELNPSDVGNPMGPGLPTCVSSFTVGQGIRIREWIANNQTSLSVQAMRPNNVALDLYVKDSHDDVGKEPNETTANMWSSPDIWVRRWNDGGVEHQNPEYNSLGLPNYINIRVINRGCETSTGNETVTVNWAKANTALEWEEDWDGSFQTISGAPMSGQIPQVVNIPVLEPGEEAIVTIPWVVPNPADYLSTGDPWHFCLLARIDAIDDPMSFPFTPNPNEMVRNNNNLAWKNMTVVDVLNDPHIGGVVGVSNVLDRNEVYNLNFFLDENEMGKPLYEEAEITIEMDSILFDAWDAGGRETINTKGTRDNNKLIVTGDNASLNNLKFPPNARGSLLLTFNFLTQEYTEKEEYIYHVTQEQVDNSELWGGETYVVKKSNRTLFTADGGGNNEVDENESITISAADISEPAIYNWYDSEGNLIFVGKDLTVSTDVVDTYKLEVIALSDGFKDYDEIAITMKPSRLESIAPNPASNNITVDYKLNGVNSAYLMVLGYYGSNTSYNYILNKNNSQISLDISSYPQGVYTVSLVCDGEIVDAKNLIRE